MAVKKSFKINLDKEVGPLTFALFARVSRNSLDLSQEEFGKKFGLSRANVCDIEKGRHFVSADLALRIARNVGLPEKTALQACLQDLIHKAGSSAKVTVS